MRLSRPILAALLVASLVSAPTAAAQFPDHDEVAERVDGLREHPWVTVHERGESVSGRTIWAVEVTDPTSEVPMADRPVTLILTQQHGNEPAGTPAVLDLLKAVANGSMGHVLSNQVLVALPMANPDGAQQGSRANGHGQDLNRDHVALSEPETRAMHRVLNGWEVDVALDHHEYAGIGYGNPVPVRVYDHDLTTLYPRHGNVRLPTRSAAETLMYEGVWPEAREAGYSANEYGEVTAADVPVTEIAGGPDPGILRNHLGLHHVAGLLVESRVDPHPNPFHDAERRIDIHRVVMDATVAFVHHHPELFTGARDASIAETRHHPHRTYVEGDRRGPLHEAYEVPGDADIDDVLAGHGRPGTVEGVDGTLVPVETAWQGHDAALVHPDSSRALVDATPATLPDAPTDATEAAGPAGAGEPTPGVGAVLVVAAAAIVAGWRRRD